MRHTMTSPRVWVRLFVFSGLLCLLMVAAIIFCSILCMVATALIIAMFTDIHVVDLLQPWDILSAVINGSDAPSPDLTSQELAMVVGMSIAILILSHLLLTSRLFKKTGSFLSDKIVGQEVWASLRQEHGQKETGAQPLRIRDVILGVIVLVVFMGLIAAFSGLYLMCAKAMGLPLPQPRGAPESWWADIVGSTVILAGLISALLVLRHSWAQRLLDRFQRRRIP